ncbi:MAG TPA: response regulator [Patescibacteria group bacterium]|nr:response regulator [Patescibacteria group bacterium]
MRVLIADDSALSRSILKNIISAVPNVEISEVSNGVQALEQHRFFRPDVILMDITMPQLDGVATLKIIKKIDKEVQVIIVSSIGRQKTYYTECYNYGAFAVLSKPIEKELVLKTFYDATQGSPEGELQ